jgi:hypothetical protein
MIEQIGRDAVERALFTPVREGCGGALVFPDNSKPSYLPVKWVVTSLSERSGDMTLSVRGVTIANGNEARRLDAAI